MVEARQRSDWWHTAALLATIRNALTVKGKKVSVRDCHPMENQRPKVVLKGKNLSILKDVFCPQKETGEK